MEDGDDRMKSNRTWSKWTKLEDKEKIKYNEAGECLRVSAFQIITFTVFFRFVDSHRAISTMRANERRILRCDK